VPDGGSILEAVGDSQTKLTVFKLLVGHGIGNCCRLRPQGGGQDADAFAQRIKAAVEAA